MSIKSMWSGKPVLVGVCIFLMATGFTFREEMVSFNFDGREWKIGFNKQSQLSDMIEWVLEGEKVEAWSELVTVNKLKLIHKLMPLEQFYEMDKKRIKDSSLGKIEWKVIHKRQNDIMYEWILTGDPVDPDQHEIARKMVGEDGFYSLHYVIKTNKIPSKRRNDWMKIIKDAKIVSKPVTRK